MLNVTRIPAKYRFALCKFKQAFRESRNYTTFTHMAIALISAQEGWTVTTLTDQISRPDEKSRRAYNYFFTNAAWAPEFLAQALLVYLCARLQIKAGDELRLHVDDTFVRKFGDATDGVGNFRNPTAGRLEDGNVLVTSCLQYGDLYVPFRIVPYLGKQEASSLETPFRTKLELVVEEIVEPLQLPAGAAVTVVADSAYYSKDTVMRILEQGNDVVCRLKSDKHVRPQGATGTYRVTDYVADHELSVEEVTICVREREKTYRLADDVVELTGLDRPIRLVVTERDGTRRYYMSTDLDRSAVEILELAEDRWNIETFHQQAGEQFGIKSYELETVEGIERFLQVVCVAWTLVVLEEIGTDAALWEDEAQIGDRLSRAHESLDVATLIKFSEHIESSLPEAERRRIAREYIA